MHVLKVGITLIFVSMLVGGCGYTWQKYGATKSDYTRDTSACVSQRKREYPVTMERVLVRTDTVCGNTSYSMNCTSTPIYEMQNTSPEAPLLYHRSCMISKGWRRVKKD